MDICNLVPAHNDCDLLLFIKLRTELHEMRFLIRSLPALDTVVEVNLLGA